MATPPSINCSCLYEYFTYTISIILTYPSSATAVDVEMSRSNGAVEVFSYESPYTSIGWSNAKSETTYYFRARSTYQGVTSAWGDYATVTTPAYPTSLVAEYYPSYKPQTLHQWVYNPVTGYFVGQANNCGATSIATMKEIHEKRERGQSYLSYSIGWIYGNRLSTDLQTEGVDMGQALNKLQADGVPQWSLLPENSGKIFPDNYYYLDNVNGISIGAKTLVNNNKNTSSITTDALKQKISSWTQYNNGNVLSVGVGAGFGSSIIDIIKQRIINDGCVLLVIGVPSAFDQLSIGSSGYISTGYIPDTFGSIRGYHAVNIIGWKIANGKKWWIIHNNWDSWGDSADLGRAYMPLEWDYIYSFYTVLDYINLSSNFYWSTAPISGGFLSIAADWNSLTSKINLKRTSKGLSTIAFTNVVAGETILTASIINEAINGFVGLTYTESLPSMQVSGNLIYPSFFISLQNCYNSIV